MEHTEYNAIYYENIFICVNKQCDKHKKFKNDKIL